MTAYDPFGAMTVDPSIRNEPKDPFLAPKELQHAYQTAEEHSAFAEEKSCNTSASMSKLHQSHTEKSSAQPPNHADTAAQIQSSLSTNNDSAVPISIKDALFVDEKTEKIATRDPRMSSADVKTRFLTEEQLREVKREGECEDCEAGEADAGDERVIDVFVEAREWGTSMLASLPRGTNGTGAKGYGARNGGQPMGDLWTGGSKIGKFVSGTEK